MRAYHNNEELKAKALNQMKAHIAADELVKGQYWHNGKGCAIGCLSLKGAGAHQVTSDLLGFELPICHLIDRLFEGLPNAQAMEFPVRFLESVPVGADLSSVTDKFLLFVLRDVLQYANDTTRPCVETVITLYNRKIAGNTPSNKEFADAALAAEAATWATEAAEAAWAARAAAEAATWATEAAADATTWAAGAARATEATARAYVQYADELIRLVGKYPVAL